MAVSGRCLLLVTALQAFSACAHPAARLAEATLQLAGTDGVARTFPDLSRGAPATVLVFFSHSCPCMQAHDRVLRELAQRSAAGVQVFAVDSEYGATLDTDRAEAERRQYPFPILLDPGAQLASTLGAEFATFTVVFDSTGALRYRGGFDSDKTATRADSQPWAARAVDAVLGGRTVEQPQTKALGCALQRW